MIKRKKGVALLWALVLSSVLLIVSGTMVSYIVKESQFSVRTTDSTAAYSYAKSGVEWAKYCIDIESDPNACDSTANEFDFNNDGEQDTVVTTTGSPGDWLIESTSTVNSVTRKLEYRITDSSNAPINPPITNGPFTSNPSGTYVDSVENLSVGSNSESFEFQFDMWLDSWYLGRTINPNDHKIDDLLFGLNQQATDSNSDGVFSENEMDNIPYIALRSNYQSDSCGVDYSPAITNPRYDTLELEVFDGNNITSVSIKDNTGDNFSLENDSDAVIPYVYRVNIRYIKDTVAAIKICKLSNFAAQDYDCVGYASTPLLNVSLGNLSTLFWHEPCRNSSEMVYTNTVTEADSTFIMLGSEYTRYRFDNMIIKK